MDFFKVLQLFIRNTKVSSTIGILLSDLLFDVLKMDPSTNIFVGELSRVHSQLLYMIELSIQMIKSLYQTGDIYRSNIHQLLIQLLHDSFWEVKSPYRPLIIDSMFYSEVASNNYRITNGTYCLLTIIQSMVRGPYSQLSDSEKTYSDGRPVEPEDAMFIDCHRVISGFIMEIFQRFSNKETAPEYYQTLNKVLEEMISASRSPVWPSASIFIERAVKGLLLQLKNFLGEGNKNNEANQPNLKRDNFQINQTLDSLSFVSESISILIRNVSQLNSEKDRALNSSSTVTANSHQKMDEFVLQAVRAKWNASKPVWQKMVQKEENENSSSNVYWETAESPNKKQQPSPAKKSKEKSTMELLPFLKQLDSIMDINSDIINLLDDNVSAFENPSLITSAVSDGAIDFTFQLLPRFNESYDLSRLFQGVNPLDLKYSRLLKYLIEQNGAHFFYNQDSGSSNGAILEINSSEEALRDACLFTLSFWAHYKKVQEQQLATGNGNARAAVTKDSSCPAILQFALNISEKHVIDQLNPNYIQKTKVPEFVLDLKSQPRKIVQELTVSVVVERTFHSLLSNILKCFLFMISDSAPLIRARSVKSLSRLIQTNYSLLTEEEELSRTIVSLLYDRSIAVREEGVKLIAPIIACGYPKYSDLFLEELKPLLLDEGISVRKSSIMLIRDVLQNQPIHPQYIDLCIKLLERLAFPKEEESIKELICAIFQQIWFSPPTHNAILVMRNLFVNAVNTPLHSIEANESKSSEENQDGGQQEHSGNPYYQLGLLSRALSKGTDTRKQTSIKDFNDFHFEFTALQLIEIALHESSHSWILALLQELLHGKATGNETSSVAKQRRDAAYQHCYKIVSFMVELLLLIEENKHQAIKNFLSIRQFSSHEYKACIIATVALFCEAHPPFVSKHLLTFLPYLKGDSSLSKELNMVVSGHIIRILESTALLEKSNLSLTNPQTIIQDLVNIAFTHSGSNISSSISCFASFISCVTLDAAPYFGLIRKCFEILSSAACKIASGDFSPEQTGRILRFMVMFGYICEHSKKCKNLLLTLPTRYFPNQDPGNNTTVKTQLIHEIDKLGNKSFTNIQMTEVDPRTFQGIAYSAVIFGLSLKDLQIQLRSIQALCGIFSGYPRLMLLAKDTQLIDRILSREFNELIHERVLIGLKDMMVSEEKLLEKKASLKQMKESGVQLNLSNRETVLGGPVDHDSDATIAGFVLQQYLKQLTDFLRMKSISLRYATLQLLATLLRQGMICPLDILALAIMLLGDENDEIREESFTLLQIQDERYPNFLDSRLIEGVEKTHDFQLSTFHALNPLLPKHRTSDAAHSIFSNLYISCIVPNKKRKINFLYGMLRKTLSMIMADNLFVSVSLSGKTEGENDILTTTTTTSSSIEVLAGNAALSSPSSPSTATTMISPKGTPSNSNKFVATPGSRHSVSKPLLPVQTITDKNFVFEVDQLFFRFSKVKFFAITLSSLPFGSIDEVLHVIHWIGRSVPTHCVVILKNLEKSFLQSFGGAIVGKDPLEKNVQLDELKVKDIYSNSSSSNDFHQLFYDLIAYELQLRTEEILIRLKSYFKIVYYLSDEKCQMFDPNEKTGPTNPTSSEKLNNDRSFDFTLAPEEVKPIEDLLTTDSLKDLFDKKSSLATALFAGQEEKGETEKKTNKKKNNKENSKQPIESVSSSTPSETIMKTPEDREKFFFSVLQQCVSDYNRVHHIIHSEGDDFKLESSLSSSAAGSKRKKTPSKSIAAANSNNTGEGEVNGKKKPAKKTPVKGKKGGTTNKRKRSGSFSDEEDENEDEFMFGMNEDDEDDDSLGKKRKKAKTTPTPTPITATATAGRKATTPSSSGFPLSRSASNDQVSPTNYQSKARNAKGKVKYIFEEEEDPNKASQT
jgi:hypothetical protein